MLVAPVCFTCIERWAAQSRGRGGNCPVCKVKFRRVTKIDQLTRELDALVGSDGDDTCSSDESIQMAQRSSASASQTRSTRRTTRSTRRTTRQAGAATRNRADTASSISLENDDDDDFRPDGGVSDVPQPVRRSRRRRAARGSDSDLEEAIRQSLQPVRHSRQQQTETQSENTTMQQYQDVAIAEEQALAWFY